jgi:hypothetical protein
MAQKTKKTQSTSETAWMQNATLRISRAHFGLVIAYVFFILASDAWNLVTMELTSQRWIMAGAVTIVTTIVWYLTRANLGSTTYYRTLLTLLVLVDIALATFVVYTERGMASRGVALYAIPIAISAAMLNRSAIFGTAILATTTYVVAATRYFYIYFNEGYKIELYATIGIYSATFFILAAILWIIMTAHRSTK